MQNNSNDAAGYKAPAVHKAFQLLRTIAQSQTNLGITDLAQQLGYSKSTTHGLVHALLREGALTHGAGARKLYLGPAIAELMFSNWHQEKVKELAQPVLNDIRDRVNATVILGARVRNRVLIIASAEPSESIKISVPVGSTIPLIAGAVGKVFLAGEKPELAAKLISEQGLRSFTPHSTTDTNAYLAELDRVREKGYAVDIEEYLLGIRAVAVALNNRRGLPTAVWAVGISTNMDSAKMKMIARITAEGAEKLQRELDE
ncbi:MAG: IclR family transcriptional regulator [Deltaproteobacteria bacterium]|nr:IclR family transcriptional regulator [Deltaproteobacteria bacterium]